MYEAGFFVLLLTPAALAKGRWGTALPGASRQGGLCFVVGRWPGRGACIF